MSLYTKLEEHFNQASVKHPQFKRDFDEALSIYKKAILDKDPLCLKLIEMETRPVPGMPGSYSGDMSCRRQEVVDVLKSARRIYLANTP